jgi:energy-converting hydrogenase Eha subunit C
METVLGLIRHLLTFGGGFLVAKGYLDEASAGELVGAVTTIVGIVWSGLSKSDKFPAIK